MLDLMSVCDFSFLANANDVAISHACIWRRRENMLQIFKHRWRQPVVGIEKHEILAVTDCDSSIARRRHTGVGLPDEPDTWVVQRAHEVRRIFVGAIVDDDYFEFSVGLPEN